MQLTASHSPPCNAPNANGLLLAAAMQFFVEHYNTKKPDDALEAAQFHLERKNAPLHGDELLHFAVQKHDDLFLRAGVSNICGSLLYV